MKQVMMYGRCVALCLHVFAVFSANVTKIPVKYVKIWQKFLFIRLYAKPIRQNVMDYSEKKAQFCIAN